MIFPLMLTALIGPSPAPPVALAKCEVSTPVTLWGGDGDTPIVGGYGLQVRFSDTAPESISRVTFTLDDGTNVTDVGTFSPGVTINHKWPLASTGATSCSVTAVTFADGANWHAN